MAEWFKARGSNPRPTGVKIVGSNPTPLIARVAEWFKATGLRPVPIGVKIVGSNPTSCIRFLYLHCVDTRNEVE